MKKGYILIVIIFFVGAVFLSLRLLSSPTQNQSNTPPAPSNTNTIVNNSSLPAQTNSAADTFLPPLTRSGERVTKKPFGIFITPQTSPVQPEHFRGYHTGADFEIFSDELNAEVAVRAVCTGPLSVRETASGYGGVAVQSCQLNGEAITVIYGHLRLSSIKQRVGDTITRGDELGVLGNNYSSETGGERKHLHLGFHKGTDINIKGYVGAQSELSGWLDPCLYVCHN
ncbi:MAG: peptidoglycan DD-metalloendopeptidase family protein [Patescibacteria group bacterium]